MKTYPIAIAATLAAFNSHAASFQTRYARIQIDDKGFITSIVGQQSGKEYSPPLPPAP